MQTNIDVILTKERSNRFADDRFSDKIDRHLR
uniref:Uncharacterized protein n=1 Tax=Anguilla anguilla TaxID=7936 RepID=A0A0E9VA12_ANGAN